MGAPIQMLNELTTDELVGEVVRRTAADRPALQRLGTQVIRARLAERDRDSGKGTQADLNQAAEPERVLGTTEMGLADGER